MIVTFYSYKGGLGRTMAVANVATLLAQEGHTVVAVDWDLEAPGLHHYFGLTDRQLGKGVIDYLYDYKNLLSGNSEVELTDLPKMDDYLTPVTDFKGKLLIMPAGRQDAFYAERVLNFDWMNFYERWDGGRCIEFMKR